MDLLEKTLSHKNVAFDIRSFRSDFRALFDTWTRLSPDEVLATKQLGGQYETTLAYAERDLRREKLRSQPSVIEDAVFWALIAASVGKRGTSSLVRALAKRPESEIRGFEVKLREFLFALDTERHAARGGTSYNGSGDSFLYRRCAVVAQGESTYRAVLADPTLMPGDDDWFEELLFVAGEAYERADHGVLDVEGPDYETGSNSKMWEPRDNA